MAYLIPLWALRLLVRAATLGQQHSRHRGH